ncbi:MAG TPA: class I SAM-dependent methyltransferase [Candidatus Micrarchaeaceae archaeon]|nr:class I SAM-dependent methyltransferase [Candidatus Micrarchaeaceae archaeon]
MSRGDRYERTYELRAAAGEEVHGEANFVSRFSPTSVLDAGCGTGRVGRELHRRGVDVVGIDLDAEMLETARARCGSVEWIEGDISAMNLGRTFDIVLMAGNVINFVIPERRQRALENLVKQVRPAGLLINGHSIRPDGCPQARFEAWAEALDLELVERWSTWDQDPFTERSEYGLTVHRLRA